jgi:hypothetical protein
MMDTGWSCLVFFFSLRIPETRMYVLNKLKFSFYFSNFMKAVEKLEAGDYEGVLSLCRKEIDVSPPTHYCQLALLLRGTMFCLTAQSDQAQLDLDQLLNVEQLDRKVGHYR